MQPHLGMMTDVIEAEAEAIGRRLYDVVLSTPPTQLSKLANLRALGMVTGSVLAQICLDLSENGRADLREWLISLLDYCTSCTNGADRE
ncbi:MAG: hypothetical protein J2P48_10125 [Alphaproteobacteria bacterium]|nr:hypothetical protein [Alphaproteobacteria bacterium]